MESLTKHWRNLSLNEREGGKLSVKKNRESQVVTLVAKFLTKRVLNTEAIVRTFSPLWRAKKGFKVRDAGEHMMLFEFDHAEEVNKILRSEPWSFDRYIVVLHKLENTTPMHELKFNSVAIWVQVHNIPITHLNRTTAEELCEVIGVVDHESNDNEVDRGSFFRVRVRTDISVPLCRGRILSIEDDEDYWVEFKYERLPNICYWCGCLDHSDKDCERWIESEGTLASSEREYGPWIRATPTQARQKPVVVVPGFYESRRKGGSQYSCPATEKEVQARGEARETGAQSTDELGKETANPEEEISETIIAPNISVPKKEAVLNAGKNGNNRSIKGNKGDPFEDHLKEIDRELNGADISENLAEGAAAIKNQMHVEIVDLNACTLGTANIERGKVAGADHVDVLNSFPSDNNLVRITDSQDVKVGSVGNEGQARKKTWTRLAREVQKGGNQKHVDGVSLSKRSFMEVDTGDFPTKRRLVAPKSQGIYSMVEAAEQPRQEQ